MHEEFAPRRRAFSLRFSGRPVPCIRAALGRSLVGFHKWWGRDLESGAEGLHDLTLATHHVAHRLAPEWERAILSIRRRLPAHAWPATRYRRIGAPAILAELEALDIRPLPNPRTIERVLQRHGLTAPRVRLARLLPRPEYPGPQARASQELPRSISADQSTSRTAANATPRVGNRFGASRDPHRDPARGIEPVDDRTDRVRGCP
jgi:hypothetical protein